MNLKKEKKGVSVKKSEEDRIAPTLYLDEIIEDAKESDLTLAEVLDKLLFFGIWGVTVTMPTALVFTLI